MSAVNDLEPWFGVKDVIRVLLVSIGSRLQEKT